MGFLFGSGGNFQAGAGGLQPGELLKPLQNTNDAERQRQLNFIGQIGNLNGFNQQADVYQQQQALANTLQQQAAGAGPNPALNQLALTTGQNVANQAALMAGQRGVSHNPGLAGQLIGQQGAGIQQQAVGQAAVLRAQQQLAAQQQLMQQQGALQGINTGNMQFQAGVEQNVAQNALQNTNILSGLQQNLNNSNVQAAGQNQGLLGKLFSGLGGAAGSALAGPLGGLVGGGGGGQSAGTAAGYGINTTASNPNAAYGRWDQLAHGGQVKSPLQEYHDNKMACGGSVMKKDGGRVPGKAEVSGDSEKNDKVKALLSPGEVVIPRSKVRDPQKTAAFINAVLGMNLRSGSK